MAAHRTYRYGGKGGRETKRKGGIQGWTEGRRERDGGRENESERARGCGGDGEGVGVGWGGGVIRGWSEACSLRSDASGRWTRRGVEPFAIRLMQSETIRLMQSE
jgi:hypothetical protein